MLHSHLVPDVCLFLATGVMPALGRVWKKGFGQLKAGWESGIRPGCSSVSYRIFLQQKPYGAECPAATNMGNPVICPNSLLTTLLF